ncbi:MAG TPA: hypothetical protein HA254_00530 [Candidatus Diapherotrites archaeon]|uniref:Uncharacterized protein n=1 Tax=Candidatus Iainarchaeum sp. TaxID=3101447 RepID=A0A7J4IXY3_9ARCH|nr:hypothetical protein [Candidatus Diapherotrites archaeon]
MGVGSAVFLERSRTGRALAKLTGNKGRGAEYLPDIGPYGILLHAIGIYGIARVHSLRKRRDVVRGISALMKAQPAEFKHLAFSTARFLWQNSTLRATAVYDPHAEDAIYKVIGEMAQNSRDYKNKYPKGGRQTIENYGKQYFRHLVRHSLLSDFKFLQSNFSDPERKEALRFALVGHDIDPLREESDKKRLSFLEEIFDKDVPELNRFHSAKGKTHRALDALIRLRWRAKMSLPTSEAIDFFYKACDYYNIPPREVDRYAIQSYWGIIKIPKPRKPQLSDTELKTSEGRVKLRQLEIKHEKEVRVMNARLMELRERIGQIYGHETLEKYKPPPAREEQPRIIIPPAARFHLDKVKLGRGSHKQTTEVGKT